MISRIGKNTNAWLEDTFSQLSDFELQKELDRRKKFPTYVSVDRVIVEFTCSECNEVSQVLMEDFSNDGTVKVFCDMCGTALVVDLEEN